MHPLMHTLAKGICASVTSNRPPINSNSFRFPCISRFRALALVSTCRIYKIANCRHSYNAEILLHACVPIAL